MLISLSKKFIFIANLKAASTAIEKALRPVSELALVESRFGKHLPFRQIEARFSGVIALIDPRDLFVFGVMRDPIDYVTSLYNSHMDPKFKDDPALYTGDLDFDRFLGEWALRNADQTRQQYLRFVDRNGCLAANYVISYDRLDEGLRFVSERIGVKSLLSLGRENKSHGAFDRSSLRLEHIDWIESHFAQDRQILNTYCDRLLASRPFLAPSDSHPGAEGQDTDASSAPPDRMQVAETGVAVISPTVSEALSTLQFVRALYRVLLLREPDASGLKTYMQRVQEGRPIEEIMRQLLRSQEFSKKHARFQEAYLSRAPVERSQQVPTTNAPGERG